jgi:hypothetical protein
MTTKRDDFSKPVIRTLASHVNYHCSNPECRRPTLGPSSNENEFVNIGKAAHITAAARGGPRYDPNLTREARRAISNGIWLCAIHADQVDKDADGFPVELLRKWKRDAVERTRVEAFTNSQAPPTKIIFELDEDDKAFLLSLALPGEDNIEAITPRMMKAAKKDIEIFISDRNWPEYVIPLNLTLLGEERKSSVTLDGIANGINVAEAVSLISPPGTGKTTTIIQLAESILNAGQTIAAFVPLGEWSNRQETWFEFLGRRNAFRLFKSQHFMQLAYHGRLVLLLDGWNELNPDARKRANDDLKSLKREFPQLGIVIGTRKQALSMPGAVMEIEALSDDQQRELASKLRGKDGEALVDQAWRTPGVRELISIPLYLNALLASTPGTALPQTKEEVLNTFITQHENAPEKAAILRNELLGFHKFILIGLAVEANKAASTTLSDADARRAISKVVAALQADHQLTAPLQPTTVLDVLVNTHSLIQGADSVSFQHQQFQEWYASFEVERMMLDAAQGNADTRRALRIDVLNWPAWEESVLFACERVSRKDASGAKAVAAAILDALGIDPMLAAEMIYRSAPEVWPHISDKIVSFAKRWHTPGKVDRAVRFMITSGQPEFVEHVWPLISHSDDQIYLEALRTARRFRPSVLGPDAAKRLAALPEEIRRHVVADIGQHSGFDGMELAADIAKSDKSPAVVVEILQALQFRRADRHVTAILQTASDEVWQLIARKGYPNKLLDATLDARLMAMRHALIISETDPIRLLGHLAEGRLADMNAEERVTQLIQSPDFPVKDQHARVAVENAFKIYPHAVATAMLQRVATGLVLPYGVHELLENTAPVDDGPIAAAALDKATPEPIARAAYTIVGPVSVGRMMDALFMLDDEFHAHGRQLAEPARKEYQRLKDAITVSRQTSFLPALLERAKSYQPRRIRMMADLLARHGKNHEKEPFKVSGDIEKGLTSALEQWVKIMLTSAEANRHQFADVARAIERHAQPQFVSDLQEMLERDLADWARAREEFKKLGRSRTLTPDVTHDNTLQYRRTFAAIGDASVIALMLDYLPDLRFGFDAACVLLDIWNRDHSSGIEKRFASWHDFPGVKARRARLQNMREEPPTCEFAEAIFEVVRNLGTPEKDTATQQHALKLANIGLSMPHGVKRPEIDTLLNLPQQYAVKLALFTVAAIAGEIIPADMLIAAIQELLEAGKKEQWRLREDRGELMDWVELFAFADRPMAVLEIIDLLPAQYQRRWQLRRLLIALGYSPHGQALQVLEALAKRDSHITRERDWLDAMMRLETEAAARAILDVICEGKIEGERGGIGIWRLSEQLTSLARKFPPLRDEILQRYEKIASGEPRAILEAALIEVADTPTILALIRSYAANKQPYDGQLSEAIEKLAIGQRPITDWPGAFEQFSVPLVKFRKELFAMLAANNAQSALAEACLNEIERLRDEHGRISDEPRHPDILSDQAWPKEVSEPA